MHASHSTPWVEVEITSSTWVEVEVTSFTSSAGSRSAEKLETHSPVAGNHSAKKRETHSPITVGAGPGTAGPAALPDAAGPAALSGCSNSGEGYSGKASRTPHTLGRAAC